MTIEIGKKIVGYEVKADEEASHDGAPTKAKAEVIQMHERVERPDMLLGSTYK